ncbi:peroxiredoxin [Zymomonas mobilis]|uniref:Putative peroxiredoxin, bacterioferritin comigratory protein n=1 Tax=Zymomonas mobilis subsp. pomaceae (strain ATCC 29192 / DSM 22645 / JCM 10191 / CCUG 17912 / NBRC 13757 / NCIMB 11200 / NRRL B-4491 / Barker I) TaxID=579138 RepID=F8EVL3_ZYMMT|nr:peroxiredoxin [Zymomonas mobilis]AEI38350.1 putative peroxiredoxin, bacterioferritin comigratory protein [Zymomonas mobilis subsp. pomaceae ATCC 29192]MDX5948039.1 peroxiredoxin [Zymomonas mobilis subsp. pomaceae]GEB89369.1 peroxiredoxin [Zymomonas mobilis subsp. pomaceae]
MALSKKFILKSKIIAALLTLGLANIALRPSSAKATLSSGFHAPPFKVSGITMGQPFHFDLDQMLKNGPVVLYFSSESPDFACSREAEPLIKSASELRLYGAFLIAFSVIKNSMPFTTGCRSRLPVAIADTSVTRLYALNNPLSPQNNTTYVIAPDRRILLTYVSSDTDSHMIKALEVIKNWQKNQKIKR